MNLQAVRGRSYDLVLASRLDVLWRSAASIAAVAVGHRTMGAL